MTAPTSLCGLMFILSSVPHFLTSANKEFGEAKVSCGARAGGSKHWTQSTLLNKETSCKDKCTDTIDGIRRGNKVGFYLIFALWIFLHIVLAIARLVDMLLAYNCSTFIRDNEAW